MKKNKKILPLFLLLLTGCNTSRYKLAYQGIDELLNQKYGEDIIIEECYYIDDNVLGISEHVLYNFNYLNEYNQRINRKFMYLNNGAIDDFVEANKYYETAINTSFYIELDVEKLNQYIKEKN